MLQPHVVHLLSVGIDQCLLLHGLLVKTVCIMSCSIAAAGVQVRALLALQSESPVGVLMKAEVEVMRQQPRKAFKTLSPLLAASADQTARWVAGYSALSGQSCICADLIAVHPQVSAVHAGALFLC